MSERAALERTIQCPSGRPDTEGSLVFGVATATSQGRRIAYLTQAQPASPEVLALAEPAQPTEVFRIAAPCAGGGCKHFDGTDCTLARRIVRALDPVVDDLPRCQIRRACRWFHQEGKAACLRCPQVVTDRQDASDLERRVADGDSPYPA